MNVFTSREQYNDHVDALRKIEYPMLKSATYLDHAGTALCSRSLIDAFSADMLTNLSSNPHSASASSLATEREIDDIRVRALKIFGASPNDFDLVFVANATAAIKLVAEAFRDQAQGFCYGYHRDAHTSLVGVREVAENSFCFRSDSEVESWLQTGSTPCKACERPFLFAYPGQSNLNGRRLPLNWSARLRSHHKLEAYTLLDAAALVSTGTYDLSNSNAAPDFTVVSFYKIYGFPDLGALIVRKDASHAFQQRRYFGGGTVEAVSCLDERWHALKTTSLHAQLEDGTLPIRNIVALRCAMDAHVKLYGSQEQVSAHTLTLAKNLYNKLQSLEHSNGRKVCIFYRDEISSYDDPKTQGPIIAFNLLDSRGSYHSCYEVNKLAAVKDIQLRTGMLCNPGGAADALGVPAQFLKDAFNSGLRCGGDGDIRNGKSLAIVRISLGAPSTTKDIDKFVQFVKEFFVEEETTSNSMKPTHPNSSIRYRVESLSIYPIKSCGAWRIPASQEWLVVDSGLAWDRQWCLVHQGTKAFLSQKRCPGMALIRPDLDLSSHLLHVEYCGHLIQPEMVPKRISISLSIGDLKDKLTMLLPDNKGRSKVQPRIYDDSKVTEFFSVHLRTPCYLALFESSAKWLLDAGNILSPEYQSDSLLSGFLSKASHNPSKFLGSPSPSSSLHRSMANESPILTISKSSLDYINAYRKQICTDEALSEINRDIEPESFRANILLAPQLINGNAPVHAEPFEEETWSKLQFSRPAPPSSKACDGRSGVSSEHVTVLSSLGPCRRCQMICIDQHSGERFSDPFITLSKLRRDTGGVFFGVHCSLSADQSERDNTKHYIKVGDLVTGY